MQSKKCIATFTAVLGVLFLSACGGGGGSGSGLSDEELDRVRSDPRVVRLGGILERADTLLLPSVRLNYSLSAQGQTLSDRLVERFSCSGARCVGQDGTVVTVADLLDPDTDIDLTEVTLGSRGGFDTVTTAAKFDTSSSVQGVTVTDFPSASSYGFWGTYGFAAVEIGDGGLAGRSRGVSFTGNMSWAGAYVVGDAAGTNPGGIGSATWRGIAEAASTRTFQRRQGTATVTIADLSRPRVGVDIDITGFPIGSPAWSDMRLARGHFATGSVGTDRLEGNFHGPDHSETYGTFDTGAYVGAFGAKRAP